MYREREREREIDYLIDAIRSSIIKLRNFAVWPISLEFALNPKP